MEPTTTWEKDRKHYEKKHPRELAAMLNNLRRYIELIKLSPNARSVKAGFLHPEPSGVVAVDQKAGGQGLMESRLYTYADEASKVLYLITMGNKDDQQNDIQVSKNFVQEHFPPPEQG